ALLERDAPHREVDDEFLVGQRDLELDLRRVRNVLEDVGGGVFLVLVRVPGRRMLAGCRLGIVPRRLTLPDPPGHRPLIHPPPRPAPPRHPPRTPPPPPLPPPRGPHACLIEAHPPHEPPQQRKGVAPPPPLLPPPQAEPRTPPPEPPPHPRHAHPQRHQDAA